MEKRKAHYHLDEIKQAFASSDKLRMSVTALMTIDDEGYFLISFKEK